MSQLAWITPFHPGHSPDQGLPSPEHPVDPGYGVGGDAVWPPVSLPPLPPGVWPSPPVGVWPPSRPGVPTHPIVIYPPHPGHGLPPGPDNTLPGAPPKPDQGLPGGRPPKPDQGLPPGVDNTLPGGGGSVDNSLPMPPATIWPPLPPGVGIAGKALILVWVVGVGYRWIVVGAVDVWPPQPVRPDNTLPPSAQPK
jgi:hypothetical protein